MRAASLLFTVSLLSSCQPDLGPTGSIVVEPTILAIQAEPAEASPGDAVTYRALVASPTGTIANASLQWAYCTAPKPPSEDNAVSPSCLGDSAIIPFGGGSTATGSIPVDTCALFGPDVPPQPAGQPSLRPRDPDVTGGYYQPLVVRLAEQPAIGLERITCNLAGASADLAAEYRSRYAPNRNPSLLGISAFDGGSQVDLSQIPPSTKVRLIAKWSPDAAETYPVFDAATNTLVDHRERLRVSWFSTAGAFDTDRTGAINPETETSSENDWLSPPRGTVHLWIVLRDDRGGVDYADYQLVIRAAR